MSTQEHGFKETLEYCSVLVFILLALPVLAVGAFVLRGVLAVVAAAVVVGAGLLYCAVPGFRGWFNDLGRTARN